jgi:hypothetical protein
MLEDRYDYEMGTSLQAMYENSVQEEYEMALKIQEYVEECNGKDSWKPYVGSQLEGTLVRFILKEKKGG